MEFKSFLSFSFLLAHKIAGDAIHNQTLKNPHIMFKGKGNISKPTRTTMNPAETSTIIVAIFFASISHLSLSQTEKWDDS